MKKEHLVSKRVCGFPTGCHEDYQVRLKGIRGVPL